MKRLLFFISISFIFFSCKYGLYEVFGRDYPVEERASELFEVDLTDSKGNKIDFTNKKSFSFILISDVHFGAKITNRPDEDFLQYIYSLSSKPDFCLCLGDVAEHGIQEEYENFLNTIVKPLEELGIKTYTTVGNHDLYNSGWNNFINYNYPYTSFYKFEAGNYSFYSIDTASGNISIPQMNALKEAIIKDSNKKFVFSHFPLYAENTLYFVMQDTDERNELISLFAKNNVSTYFGGHIHKYLTTDFGAFKEINIPAYLEQFGWAIYSVNLETGNESISVTLLK